MMKGKGSGRASEDNDFREGRISIEDTEDD